MCAEGERKIKEMEKQIEEAKKIKIDSTARLQSAKELTLQFHKLFEKAQDQITEKRMQKACKIVGKFRCYSYRSLVGKNHIEVCAEHNQWEVQMQIRRTHNLPYKQFQLRKTLHIARSRYGLWYFGAIVCW
jgi:hypothetical protein